MQDVVQRSALQAQTEGLIAAISVTQIHHAPTLRILAKQLADPFTDGQRCLFDAELAQRP
jgi:hypothetical protein